MQWDPPPYEHMFASEAWRLDPAQTSEALDEWKDFAQQYICICVYIYIYTLFLT